MGSWSQLRHDTLLYAKQSFTGIPGCEFPDAYIEPYPEFFAKIERYAEQGAALMPIVARMPDLATSIATYFDSLRNTSSILRQMAQQQRDGAAHTPEQLALINNAVRLEQVEAGCVTIEVPNGWYADLFFQREKSIEEDLTVADVHTQPADAAGNIVGRVLHVGTSYPRLLTLTVDTCVGPRAYVGMSYAYHEHVTEDFLRLTDEEWTARVAAPAGSPEIPVEVPWIAPILAE